MEAVTRKLHLGRLMDEIPDGENVDREGER